MVRCLPLLVVFLLAGPGDADLVYAIDINATAAGPAATFTFLSDGSSAYDVFVRENNERNRSRLNAVRLTLLEEAPEGVGRNNSYVIDAKFAPTAGGYFTTPEQVKARAYWEDYKIIDAPWDATIPVAQQVEFAVSTETADVYVPISYRPDQPIGIYIHINSGDGANLPGHFDSVLEDQYCIGASPDHAGNDRHDPWRITRALDLVASLKARYHVDDSRVHVGGLSGGALVSVVCGMLYPDVFTGVVPTEHVMDEFYWSKIYTRPEMEAMARRGQRWAHIFGTESYAFLTFKMTVLGWEDIFDDTLVHIVEGMDHTNAPAADFRHCLEWIETPPEPDWQFDPAGQIPDKLIWQSVPGQRFDLWFSNDMNEWEHIDGFPQMGQGRAMAHAFTPGEHGFFRIVSESGTEFMPVPGGSFEMGDPDAGEFANNPVHTVQVSPFLMQNTEVTNDQMAEVLTWAVHQGKVELVPYIVGEDTFMFYDVRNAAGDSQDLIETNGSARSRIWWVQERARFEVRKSKGSGYPCVGASWYGAAAYCNFLSEMEGLTPCYSFADWSCDFGADGYRLPTEAEWEYAARGGLVGMPYPWGDTIGDNDGNCNGHADWYDLREPYTCPVGLFPPNGFGLHDMAGNVAEMCHDWYDGDYYDSSPGVDPVGPSSGSSRVLRGGAWGASASSVTVFNRTTVVTHALRDTSLRQGFRPVRRP